MKQTRRNFMVNGASGLGLAFAGAQLPFFLGSKAQAMGQLPTDSNPHFLLHLRMNGAWDTTLGTDPHVPTKLKKRGIDDQDYFYLYSDADLVEKNGILLAPPAAPILNHVEDIAFINGMMMIADNTIHETNRAYSSSGTVKASDPFMVCQLAKALGDAPLGVAHQLEYEQIMTDGYKPVVRIDELLAPSSGTDMAEEPGLDLLGLLSELMGGANPLADAQALAFSSSAKVKKMAELEAKYLTMIDANNARLATVVRVLSAFTAGAIRYAVYDLTNDQSGALFLDTHYNHKAKHPEALKNGFENIAEIIRLLKAIEFQPTPSSPAGTSLFDYTTVVVTSEFSRTPTKQNGSDAETAGTDHNPKNNSALLFGKGIKGGQVVGASRVWSRKETQEGASRLQAQLFDFKAGKPATYEQTKAVIEKTLKPGQCTEGTDAACIDYIYPETLWKTVAQAFGLPNGTPLVSGALALPQILK